MGGGCLGGKPWKIKCSVDSQNWGGSFVCKWPRILGEGGGLRDDFFFCGHEIHQ